MYIIIIGCGRVGSQLATLLSADGHNVVIIDKDSQAFKRLGPNFNGLTMVGNGYDVELLKEAGIEKADAFAVVTNGDNTNVVSAQVAREIFHVPTVVARIYDPKREQLYREFGLEVIGGTTLIAGLIKERLAKGHFVHHLFARESKVALYEILVDAELAELNIAEVETKQKIKILTVIRSDTTLSPDEILILEQGDVLIAIEKRGR